MAAGEVLGELWAVASAAGPVDVRVFVRGVTNYRYGLNATPQRILAAGVPMSSLSIQNLDPAISIELGNGRDLQYGQGLRIPPNSIYQNGSIGPGGVASVIRFGHVIVVTDAPYLADYLGVLDATAAIQAAINALPATGGMVWFPAGVYVVAGTLDLRGKFHVVLQGEGHLSGGAAGGSLIRFTSGGAVSLLNLQSSGGVRVSGIYLQWTSAAFAGRVVDARGGIFAANDTSDLLIENGLLANLPGAGKALAVLDLDHAILVEARWCSISANAVAGISGRSAAGYSNGVSIHRCTFQLNDVHIESPGQGWDISANVFEPTAGGGMAAIRAANGGSQGLHIHGGNWFGDQTVATAPAVIEVAGFGMNIEGNFINLIAAEVGVKIAGPAGGFSVKGNSFFGPGTTERAIELPAPGLQGDGEIGPNAYTAEAFATPANIGNDLVILPRDKCRVTNSAVQAIGTAAWTTITAWDTEAYDRGGLHSNAVNPSRLTVRYPGRYRIDAVVAMASNAVGSRFARLWVNGATQIAIHNTPAVNGFDTRICFGITRELLAGDYVELGVFQDSGGNLNFQTVEPTFEISRVD